MKVRNIKHSQFCFYITEQESLGRVRNSVHRRHSVQTCVTNTHYCNPQPLQITLGSNNRVEGDLLNDEVDDNYSQEAKDPHDPPHIGAVTKPSGRVQTCKQ